MAHRRGDATFELVVVIAVENVVLAVVRIVQDQLDRGESLLEQTVLRHAPRPRRSGVATPGDVGARQIGIVPPSALVDQRLQPSAIRPGFEPNTRCSRGGGKAWRNALAWPEPRSSARRALIGFCSTAFVERRDFLHRAIEQRDLRRERVAEKLGNSQHDIDAGAVEQAERQDLDAGDPVRGLSHSGRAPSSERLGEVVAARAHVGRAPGRERQCAASPRSCT